ncbi:hypothetical protein ACOME3_001163 [Neoechinorhynchus agilis]
MNTNLKGDADMQNTFKLLDALQDTIGRSLLLSIDLFKLFADANGTIDSRKSQGLVQRLLSSIQEIDDNLCSHFQKLSLTTKADQHDGAINQVSMVNDIVNNYSDHIVERMECMENDNEFTDAAAKISSLKSRLDYDLLSRYCSSSR